MRFENSAAIARPVEDVFEYLTIIENLANWIGPVVEAKQTSPNPVRLGSTGEVKAKFLGRRMEVPTEITAWNPPHSFSAQNSGGPFPITFHYTLKSEGEVTRISVITEAEPGGFFRVAAPVFEQLARRQAQNDLETLKTLLENPR
jgi:carbon monoxide dehydrogenase subunit G